MNNIFHKYLFSDSVQAPEGQHTRGLIVVEVRYSSSTCVA